MNHDGKAMTRKQRFRCLPIGKVKLYKAEIGVLLQDIQTRLFQFRIVIVVEAIEAYDLVPTRQQALCDVKADKTGSPSHKDGLVGHGFTGFTLRASTTRCRPASSRDRASFSRRTRGRHCLSAAFE